MGNEALSVEQPETTSAEFIAIQESPEFRALKRRHRSFVFPVLAACLLWYLAYVLLAGYAHDFMAIKVFGSVNVGLLLGLSQIVTTFAVTTWYVSFANRKLDPEAEQFRAQADAAAAASVSSANASAATAESNQKESL